MLKSLVRLLTGALASVTSFDVLTKAMYEPAAGFRLSLSSDADKRLTADLEKQRKDWEAKIKSQAADAVRSQLQNAASDVLKKFF